MSLDKFILEAKQWTQAGFHALEHAEMGVIPSTVVSELPGWLRSSYIYNCMSHDNVVYAAGYLWAVWWADSQNPILGRKTLGARTWDTFDLSTISGNPIGAVGYDSHFFLSLGVSSDGKIHVTGNMHNTALRYAVCSSVTGWNVAGNWAAGTMVGSQETDVTYPTFIDTDSGLLFFYRDGVSSNGNGYINKYNATTGTWSRACQLFGNGQVAGSVNPTSNAYPTRFVVDKRGTIHVAFTWRNTGAADANWAVCYAKSSDGGATWTDRSGSAYALPIQPQTSDVLMSSAVTGSGLLNQQLNGLSVDAGGALHCTFLMRDSSNNTQIYYITNRSGSWTSTPITNWAYNYNITVNPISNVVARPDIACMPDGRVIIIYRHNALERGAIWGLDITDLTNVFRFKVCDLDTQAYEPAYSGQCLRKLGRLVMLVNVCQANGPTSTDGEYQSDYLWYSNLGFVINTQARPDSSVPFMERIGGFSNFAASQTVSNTTSPGTQIGTAIPIPPETSGAKRMYRLRAAYKQNTSGTLTLLGREVGSGQLVRMMAATETTVTSRVSPLIASQNFVPGSAYASGYLEFYALPSANSAVVYGVDLEMLRLTAR